MADSGKIAEMYVDIVARTDKLEKGLAEVKRQAESAGNSASETAKTGLSGFMDMAKGAMAALAAYAAVRETIDICKKSLDAYLEAAKAEAKVGALLKATGNAAGLAAEQLNNMANELADAVGIDDSKILNDVTANLLTFKNVSTTTFKDAQAAVLDMTAVMGGDLVSRTLMIGKALNDPIQGVGALRRVGVQLSEQQQKQVKDFMAVNDVASAQSIIMKELQSEFGGAAAAANTADGGIGTLEVSIGRVSEALGKVVLNGLKPLISFAQLAFNTHKTFQSTMDDIANSAAAERAQFTQLSTTILDLKGVVNKTAGEEAIYHDAIRQFNEYYPNYLHNVNIEKDSYKAVANMIRTASDELDAYLKKKVLQSIIEAKQGEIKQIVIDQVSLIKQRSKAQEELNTAVKNGTATQTEFAQSQKGGTYNTGITLGEKLKRSIQTANNEIKRLQTSWNGWNMDIAESQRLIDQMYKTVKEPKTSKGSTSNAESDGGERSKKDQKEKIDAEAIFFKNYVEMLDDGLQKAALTEDLRYAESLKEYQRYLADKQITQLEYNKLSEQQEAIHLQNLFKLFNLKPKGYETDLRKTPDNSVDAIRTSDDSKHIDISSFVKEPNALLKAQVGLVEDLDNGFAAAGDSLVESMGQAIVLFKQANSLLQQFLNELAQVAVKAAAKSLFGFIGSVVGTAIGGPIGAFIGGSSGALAAHGGGGGSPTGDYFKVATMQQAQSNSATTGSNIVVSELQAVRAALQAVNLNIVGSATTKQHPTEVVGTIRGKDIYLANKKNSKVVSRNS